MALTTDVNGVVKYSDQYLPYGASTVHPEPVEGQPYGFSVKERDASELMYFEARYYDPLSTRFISPDPLFAAEMEKCVESIIECNLYQYTGNNPVNWLDLWGFEKIHVAVGNTTFIVNADTAFTLCAGRQECMGNMSGLETHMKMDRVKSGGTVYFISAYDVHNKEYFDAVGAQSGATIKEAGSAASVAPNPVVKGVGKVVETTGLLIEGYYSFQMDNLDEFLFKEGLGKVGGAMGKKGLERNTVGNPSDNALDGADWIGGQVMGKTYDALFDVPKTVEISHDQYSESNSEN